MERIRRALKAPPAYEPLNDGSDNETSPRKSPGKFSWLEYSIFLILGVSMLWAWNMFLAASPYFQYRFSPSPRLLAAFSPTLISISNVTNLTTMGVLSRLQLTANYPNRIILSLILNMTSFTLLAISTVVFRDVSPEVYFAFLMIMVFVASLATGFCQNGVLAYVSGFGMSKYVQAIMTGQAVAGVLPCIVQIVSIASVPPPETNDSNSKNTGRVPQVSRKSAFAYFITATAMSIFTLVSFTILLRRHPNTTVHMPSKSTTSPSSLLEDEDEDEDENEEPPARKAVPWLTLLSKLRYLVAGVFLTFAITMFFPVFTQQIATTHSPPLARILQPEMFIPLALLFWNTGDLCGRLSTLVPSITSWTQSPRFIFFLGIARVVWIPLYLLCNRHDHGAVVKSDFFYLVVVQLFFGATNGLVGSLCIMGAHKWVDEGEREAAGGFIGFCLVAGMALGSLASFGIA